MAADAVLAFVDDSLVGPILQAVLAVVDGLSINGLEEGEGFMVAHCAAGHTNETNFSTHDQVRQGGR